MLSKATFFVLFAAVAQVSVAAIPGCLLGAISQYPTPGDMKAVCQSTDYASRIEAACKDTSTSTSDALKAFAETCKNVGVTVSTDVKSGTPSSTTGAPSGTTGTPNPTGSTQNQVSTTTTGSGSKSTGAAGKLEVGTAALFAGVGLLVAAL